MPAVINSPKSQNQEITFVQIRDVEQLLMDSIQIPYKSKFSLKPYLDAINAKTPNACPNTKMALQPILENNQEFIESHKDSIEDIAKNVEFQTILSMAIPSLLYDKEVSYISSPFQKNFIVKTPAFEEIFTSDEWLLKVSQSMLESSFTKNIQQAGIHILNKLYGQDIGNTIDDHLSIINNKTKIERHFRINLRFDFIDVKAIKPLLPLTKAQINFMLKNQHDLDLWLKYLPAENFEFSGFTIGNLYDITDIQVLSDLKNWINFNKDIRPIDYFDKVGQFIKSYIQKEDLEVGAFTLKNDPLYKDGNKNILGKTCLNELIQKNDSSHKGIFDHMLSAKRVLFIDDLNTLENPSKAEKLLIDKGVKSYLLSPITDEKDNIIAILEMSSQTANTFNYKNVPRLQPIFDHLILNFENFASELKNRVTAVIQKNFTSIHPSVSWKFEEVAKEYYIKKNNGEIGAAISPIIFKNVYPLYGQSDIVDSSKIRNQAIKDDLVENLLELKKVLDKWTSQRKLHLLEAYSFKIDKTLKNLSNEFIATDESRIVKLITEEIHPVIEKLKNRYDDLSINVCDKYFSKLDEKLGIIYNKRKKFEQSVTKLNVTISDYMETDEIKMQKNLPHFFEKYKTDGVEYNLYLGQSILENGDFSLDDLKNFRLWQLVNSCEVTRLVNKISPTLDIPLKTAELIFVYNNPLSIRFRMDEKKFDVDGAYNVRYEILKKRIDKAVIKGTGERLTQSGKVAIVYLSEKDKLEYIDFLDYLIEGNYIEPEIEELLLDSVQGADGLKALRVTVKH